MQVAIDLYGEPIRRSRLFSNLNTRTGTIRLRGRHKQYRFLNVIRSENLLLLTLPASRISKYVRMMIILCRFLDTLANVSYR